MRQFPDYK
jgi:hypothetical protein